MSILSGRCDFRRGEIWYSSNYQRDDGLRNINFIIATMIEPFNKIVNRSNNDQDLLHARRCFRIVIHSAPYLPWWLYSSAKNNFALFFARWICESVNYEEILGVSAAVWVILRMAMNDVTSSCFDFHCLRFQGPTSLSLSLSLSLFVQVETVSNAAEPLVTV